MAAAGGSQCGYCTPGFVMSMFAEQYRPGRVGACDPGRLGGNLCRCTGYRPIRDAALSLGPAPEGVCANDCRSPRRACKPVSYRCAGRRRLSGRDRWTNALRLRRRIRRPRWIAGATDMGVESNLRFRRWPHLVSLEGVDELREFSETSDAVRIGAGLSLTEIALALDRRSAGVPRVAGLFASPPIRNRATLGGNLATASPIGDSAPLLLASMRQCRWRARGEGAGFRCRHSSRGTGRPRLQPGSC